MINPNFAIKKFDDSDIFLKIPREQEQKKTKEEKNKGHLRTTNVEVYKNLFQESTDQWTFKSS